MKGLLRCLPEENPRSGDSLDLAREVLQSGADALQRLAERIGPTFVDAVSLLAGSSSPIAVSGVGKSGIVAQKLAATLTSTGSPAVFLHPTDALHGDLGIAKSVAIVLSYSGSSREVVALSECLSQLDIPVIALTGNATSPLARRAAVVIDCAVAGEAGPLGLAPTTSTTAAMAMGDALAMALQARQKFQVADFERIHPGGALGTRMALRVRHVWCDADVPSLSADATMKMALVLIANKRGTVAVVDDAGRVLGVVTAGDLTRLLECDDNAMSIPVGQVMNRTPRVCGEDDLGATVVHRMKESGIMAMPVVDSERRLLAMVHLHDLIRAGAM